MLDGIVEVDETFHGGRHTVRTHGPSAYAGNSKAVVLGAIAREGAVKLRVGGSRQRADLHAFIKAVVADDAEAIYTDDLKAYDGIADLDTRHETVNHTEDEWVRGDVHTNTVEGVWSLFKRSVIGSYHQLSTKHLDAYLGELAFRFNNRENPYMFRDTILALIEADHLSYRSLVAG
jgi:transposase-like protein